MTYNSLAELFTAIANSIRGKTGGTVTGLNVVFS